MLRSKFMQALLNATVIVALIGFLIWPWVTDRHRVFDADPARWVKYIGIVLVCIGFAIPEIVQFLRLRMRNATPSETPFIIAFVILGIGIPAAAFGQSIYHLGRLALQRPAMERFVQDNSTVCPALRCMRDAKGVTAFVWGEDKDLWTGACHDPKGVMAAARLAALADSDAGKPPEARVFGRVSRRAIPISGPFIRCAARSLETASR